MKTLTIKHFKKTWQKLSKKRYVRPALAVGALLLVAGATGLFISLSLRADTPTTVSFQAEHASKTGNVSVVSDSGAAGGSAIKFGSSVGGTSCPSPTPNNPDGPDPWGGCWPGPATTGYPHGLPGDTRTPVTLAKTIPNSVTSGTGWKWVWYENSDHSKGGYIEVNNCSQPVVFDKLHIPGTVLVNAGNGTRSPNTPCVTIKNSLIEGVIFSLDDVNDTYGPVVVQDTEVHPTDLPYYENIGRNNIYTYRVNSHGGLATIKCGSDCIAKDNWVHGMQLGWEYHYDGLGGNDTDNFVIEHNYATCGDWESISTTQPPSSGSAGSAGCTAAIGFFGDFGPINNVTINKTFMEGSFSTGSGVGGAHTQSAYCLAPGYYPGKPYPAPSNMTITNNVFGRGLSGKCGVFGPTNSIGKVGVPNGNVWSNNRYEDGEIINRVEE